MKILFVIPSLAKGGQEKAGMVLTNYLSAYHEVQVVCFESASPGDFNYKSPVHRIEIARAGSRIGKAIVVFKRIFALRKIKQQYKPDVSIAFGPTAMLVNSLSFGKEQKISSIRQSFSKLESNRFLDKLLFSISGKLVPVHNGINEELFRLYNIRNELFAYNGYDIERIDADAALPVDDSFKAYFTSPVLVHLARFDTPKCNWQLVKCFDLARKKMPGLKLLLIGDIDRSARVNVDIYNFCVNYLRSNGYRVKAIEDKIETDIANYDVIMTGHLRDPHRYISKSTLFVFPSAWEGFPNALVEAMVCGLPVMSADCATGPKEILTDVNSGEVFGVLMPVFDHHFKAEDISFHEIHQQWAQAIVALLSDKAKLSYYKGQSIKRAADFSIEKSCRKWLDIIENKG